MLAKSLTALLTVLAGIGGSLIVYWLLNKLAELMPGRWEHRIKPYLYILPAYAAITVFLLYPAVLSVINSFKDRFSQNWVGFANYESLFKSEPFRQTLLNSLLWILLVPATVVAIGLLVATLADRLGPKAENLTKTVIFLPMAISMIGAATIWRFVYYSAPAGTSQIGLLNGMRDGVNKVGGWVGHNPHLDPVAWLQQTHLHFNSVLLMVIFCWSQVGFAMVLLSAAVKGVPADTLEAARIDGASERQIFFRVVVPQIKGTLLTVFVTVTISVMKIFDIVYVVTNGNFNTNVLGNEFFNQFSTYFNYGTASAIVVIFMIAVIPVMWFQVRQFRAEEANA